jgi:hypothetical protein
MKTIPELTALLASRTLSHAEEKKVRKEIKQIEFDQYVKDLAEKELKKKQSENNQLTII